MRIRTDFLKAVLAAVQKAGFSDSYSHSPRATLTLSSKSGATLHVHVHDGQRWMEFFIPSEESEDTSFDACVRLSSFLALTGDLSKKDRPYVTIRLKGQKAPQLTVDAAVLEANDKPQDWKDIDVSGYANKMAFPGNYLCSALEFVCKALPAKNSREHLDHITFDRDYLYATNGHTLHLECTSRPLTPHNSFVPADSILSMVSALKALDSENVEAEYFCQPREENYDKNHDYRFVFTFFHRANPKFVAVYGSQERYYAEDMFKEIPPSNSNDVVVSIWAEPLEEFINRVRSKWGNHVTLHLCAWEGTLIVTAQHVTIKDALIDDTQDPPEKITLTASRLQGTGWDESTVQIHYLQRALDVPYPQKIVNIHFINMVAAEKFLWAKVVFVGSPATPHRWALIAPTREVRDEFKKQLWPNYQPQEEKPARQYRAETQETETQGGQ